MVVGDVVVTAVGITVVETFTPASGPNAVKEIYTVMKAGITLSTPTTNSEAQGQADGLNQLGAMAKGVAQLIPHIQANAQAAGTGVVATAIPVQVVVATGTGATTAPGSSTVTVPVGGIT